MNKKFYIGIYAASFGIFLLIGIPALLLAVFENFTMHLIQNIGMAIRQGMLLIYAAAILTYLQFTVVHIIYNFLMLGKMWGAIKDEQTPVTVGKAIGFLFISFFNLYWIFRAWGGYPKEYNAFAARYRLSVPALSSGVFILYPLVMLTATLILPFLLLPFVFLALVAKICDAVNALEAGKIKRQDQAMPSQSGNQARSASLIFDAPR